MGTEATPCNVYTDENLTCPVLLCGTSLFYFILLLLRPSAVIFRIMLIKVGAGARVQDPWDSVTTEQTVMRPPWLFL